MEFHEKLQQLRKQRGLTQEELAGALYVSRTAISKWESGRGYPSIDSLKAIAGFFSVTVDELLSGDEVLRIAEEDSNTREHHIRDLVFGLLDCSAAMLLFLPFFGQTVDGTVQAVSLLSLTGISLWLQIGYYGVIAGMVAAGILTLAMQNCRNPFWLQNKGKLSLLLNGLGVVLFIISRQPYAAVLMFTFLMIKVPVMQKWK